ncbi:hypothetical protein NLG42_13325 [Flavobacterium plurextorum]|uniref:hypothetical protein n=1 Tax=Flavobacterium TaxID=237 RepID=UPI00214DBE88|nr:MULTISPECIES: hypothetical protein [Flavobacterium]UUW07084.1 hypothetical protein NLG42_13325 [Flavobacterium plurextorum]
MKLQGPDSGIRWKDYQISTPTFDLSSVEKPDLSPFLIHMTGRNELLSILRGENAPEGIVVDEKQGFLRSSIPVYDGSAQYYNSSVVCFTESPLFALDFFRYRSFTRWRNDQQFGIGFSKTDLVVHRNVRPVIYLDSQSNREFLSFCNKIITENLNIVDDNGEIQNYKPLFENMKPLLFPLLEDKISQGFMWEREWRCPNSIGMTFPLSAIKVICCPKNEKDEITEILRDYADSIQVVESWREYDDVTSYLTRRNRDTEIPTSDKIEMIYDVNALQELKQQNDQTLHSLSAYYGVFRETVNQLEGRSITDTLQDLQNTSKLIADRIGKVIAEIKAKEEAKVKDKK